MHVILKCFKCYKPFLPINKHREKKTVRNPQLQVKKLLTHAEYHCLSWLYPTRDYRCVEIFAITKVVSEF